MNSMSYNKTRSCKHSKHACRNADNHSNSKPFHGRRHFINKSQKMNIKRQHIMKFMKHHPCTLRVVHMADLTKTSNFWRSLGCYVSHVRTGSSPSGRKHPHPTDPMQNPGVVDMPRSVAQALCLCMSLHMPWTNSDPSATRWKLRIARLIISSTHTSHALGVSLAPKHWKRLLGHKHINYLTPLSKNPHWWPIPSRWNRFSNQTGSNWQYSPVWLPENFAILFIINAQCTTKMGRWRLFKAANGPLLSRFQGTLCPAWRIRPCEKCLVSSCLRHLFKHKTHMKTKIQSRR